MKKILLVFFLIACSNIFAQSQQGNINSSKVNLFGNIFGDYYYKAGGDSTGNNLQYSIYKKDFNAFAFRRVNVGIDYAISESFDSRFSLSYDGPDTLADGNISVYIRDAFINWKNVFTNSNLTFGMIPTPGFTYMNEKFWGYRSVEKTIMDQRGILSSRDLGIMLSGAFDNAKDFGYYAMVGNGRGNRNENNKYKKLYGSLFGNFLDKKLGANVYADYQSNGNNQSKTTLSAFVGYKNASISIGFENFFQIQNNFNTSIYSTSTDVVPYGLSLYFNQNIIPNELKMFIRYDYYDDNINNSIVGFYQSFFTSGFDYSPAPNVHIMPNIWLNAFTPKKSQTPKYTTDVVPRLTVWYEYN